MITRRVNHTGTINWASEQLFVSSSLAGWSVGLKPVEHQQLEVWFARLLLGWIDPKTASFQRADIVPKNATRSKEPKDKRWALEPLGCNSRLTHNRLFPGRSAAAT
jgi:hypothetical protein